MDPIVCDACAARYPVSRVTEHDCDALRDQHYHQGFSDELQMLLRVQDFYRRYPQAEGRIKPHLARVLESDDPELRNRLFAGERFDQIELRPDQLPEAWMDSEHDREVVEYLRHNDFDFRSRLMFVAKEMVRRKNSVGMVKCPNCHSGRLYVPSECWDQFTEFNSVTWYWPDWHSVDADGTLYVKVTGWQGGSHWTGEQAIGTTYQDYDFWRWLVDQTEYHRLVKDDELPVIRKIWLRRTKPSNDS